MSLTTASFPLKAPGCEVTWVDRPFTREAIYNKNPSVAQISQEELQATLTRAGMILSESSCWHSPNELIFLSVVLKDDAVMALNVSLDFGRQQDPREPWTDLKKHLDLLNFECLGSDDAPSSVDDKISASLAFELWSSRQKSRSSSEE